VETHHPINPRLFPLDGARDFSRGFLAPRSFAPLARMSIYLTYLCFLTVSYMIFFGLVDQRVRERPYPLYGFLKFQVAFFLSRFAGVIFLFTIASGVIPGSSRGVTGWVEVLVSSTLMVIILSPFQFVFMGRLFGIVYPFKGDDSRLAEIGNLARKANVKKLRAYVIKTFGYPFYNAFASAGDRVFFTERLLDELRPEEVYAVAAHEIGHLRTMKRRLILSSARFRPSRFSWGQSSLHFPGLIGPVLYSFSSQALLP